MRFGSVCSGIEAASVAWEPLGWRAAWVAEIEPFPAAVLAHHYPDVPNLGDMTTVADRIRAGEVAAPDVLVGGTPCQSFSIAGLRQSLADDRGNLALHYIRIADAIDDIRRDAGGDAAWCLWENVPGVLSVRDNAFGTFLAGLCGCDDALVSPNDYGWSDAGMVAGPKRWAAWRVLDAQHFGLAQRRRRVFVLARGGTRPWACADALLPLIEGVRWNPPPRRQARQDLALSVTTRAGNSSRQAGATGNIVAFGGNNTSGPITAATALSAKGGSGRMDFETETLLVAHTLRASGFDASEDGTGRGTPLIPIPFDETQITSKENRCNPQAGDPCHPLAAGARPPTICFSSKDHGADALMDLAPTLRAMNFDKSHANAGGQLAIAFNARQDPISDTVTMPLDTDGTTITVHEPSSVRRLTPEECESLQGFPRGYTAIPQRGRPAADGPRYKALGNSFAVNVVRYIGEQIAKEAA